MSEGAQHATRRGRYALLERLADGGMGSVYLALRDGASEPCVLKQLRASVGGHPMAALRFQREAQIGAQLNHPRIARVLGAGTEDGVFCIAMELVSGLDMAAIHRTFRKRSALLPSALVIHVALEALEGLAYAHGATDADGLPLGVVHRDITLRNIMVAFDGETKLIDFGLVRSMGGALTEPGAFLGTPRFASPEQALGAAIDHRSDLYSLSVVLFELLAGVHLVRSSSVPEMLHAIVREPAPGLRDVNPTVSSELSAVIARGLAKDREERWPDAASFAAALRAAEPSPVRTDRETMSTFMRDHFRAEAKRAANIRRIADELVRAARAIPRSKAALIATQPERERPVLPADTSAADSFIDFHGQHTAVVGSPALLAGEPSLLPTVEARGPVRRWPRWTGTAVIALVAAGVASAVTAWLVRAPQVERAPSAVVAVGQASAPIEAPASPDTSPGRLPTPPPSTAPAETERSTALSGAPATAPSVTPYTVPGAVAPRPTSSQARRVESARRVGDGRAAEASRPPVASPPPPASVSGTDTSATGPLRRALARLTAAPHDATARADLVAAVEAHPERRSVERLLVQAKMALTPEAAVRLLRACVERLEPAG